MLCVSRILVLTAAALCTACAEPAPPGVNQVAWDRALHDCKEPARAYGYGKYDFDDIGHPRIFAQDTSWEVVDPCMKAKGFPAPP
ncbi:MAG TPA: hypothetical protein VNF99_04030 [Stellaceae bacterium]|nr:hypothetical protein [Stellaceae bacterium]